MTTFKPLLAAAMLIAPPLALNAQFVPGPGSPIATAADPVSIAVIDVYGSGLPGLAVANSGNNTITVLLGSPTGAFSVQPGPVTVGAGPASVAAWNFTGFAVANKLDNTVSVLQSNAVGAALTPVPGSPFAVGSAPAFVAVADFNRDGLPDLAIANSGDNTVTVLLGAAQGGFAPAAGSPFPVGSQPVSIAVADFNGDYVPDLAIANAGSHNVTVLLGDGTGRFTPAANSPFPVGAAPVSIAAADFNRDGQIDLAVANSLDNTVTVLWGAGTGAFMAAAGSPFPVGNAPSALVTADFNLDGIPDLAVANAGGNTVTVLLGTASGGFAPAPYSPLAVGTHPASIAVGDFNDDGKPDMAVANSGANTVTVLLNNYLAGVPAPRVFSAASAAPSVSAGSIVSIYGDHFAASVASAATLPLPLELGGVSATFTVANILDQPLFSQAMPLFYVSPTQIDAQIPANAPFPPCNTGSGSVYTATVQIVTPSGGQAAVVGAGAVPAPGLFTASETGTGLAAAQFVTNLPDGAQTSTDVAQCPAGGGPCVPVPLNVTAGTSALVLWGTGISEYPAFPQGLTLMAGNQPLQVFYAGASPQYAGLDQINAFLPSSLAGSGLVNLFVTLTGAVPGLGSNCAFDVTSNIVTIDIQ